MGRKKTDAELNITRQAILDHCQERKCVKDLVEPLDVKFSNLNQIMDSLAENGFLEVSYETLGSGLGGRRKYFTTLVDTYTPEIRKALREYASKAMQEPPTPGARHITMSQQSHMAQTRHAREQYKSQRTHVGISQVYHG